MEEEHVNLGSSSELITAETLQKASGHLAIILFYCIQGLKYTEKGKTQSRDWSAQHSL